METITCCECGHVEPCRIPEEVFNKGILPIHCKKCGKPLRLSPDGSTELQKLGEWRRLAQHH